MGLLVTEMLANWGTISICYQKSVQLLTHDAVAYYRYLNAHGSGTASVVFLIVGG